MGAPPHWLAYVSVPNIDDSLKQAEELGGKILAPAMDMENVGRMAVIADPQGAAIALLNSATRQAIKDTVRQIEKIETAIDPKF